MTIYSVATLPTMTSNQINDWLKRAGSRSRKTQWKKKRHLQRHQTSNAKDRKKDSCRMRIATFSITNGLL